MAGVGKTILGHRTFVDRRRYHGIYHTVLQIERGHIQGKKGVQTAVGSRLSHLDFQLVGATVHHIDAVGYSIATRLHHTHCQVFQFQHLFIIADGFRRPINNRRAHIQHPLIGQSFQYHFVAYAVNVAMRDAYF